MKGVHALFLLLALLCGVWAQQSPRPNTMGVWTGVHPREREYPHWETSMLGKVGFQPGDSLFDSLTDLLVSHALDNPHTTKMFAHLTRSPRDLERAANRMAMRVLDDQAEYRTGGAKNRHIHHAARRLGLSVMMELQERIAGGCGTFGCSAECGIVEDHQSEGEIGQLAFVDTLSPETSDTDPDEEVRRGEAASITVNDDTLFMTARWGKCRPKMCPTFKQDYGLHGCYVPDRGESGHMSVLLSKDQQGFRAMKRIFGATLKEHLPNCACSAMRPMGLSHVGVYQNRSPDSNPEEKSHVQALCFSVNPLEDYEAARPICQKDMLDLEIYAEDRRTRACMCFNTKEIENDGRKWHNQPWNRILLSANDAHKVSDHLGLGCTHYFRGWPESLSKYSIDDHPDGDDDDDHKDEQAPLADDSGDESDDESGEGKPSLTPAQKISKLWAGQKAHVSGLLSTFKELKDLFLWQLKLNVFPTQSLQIVLMCKDMSQCMSLAIQFGRGLMLFMARLVFDIIRVFWYAVQWISPSLARVMARVGHKVSAAARAAAKKVYNAFILRDKEDRLAMKGFDPVGIDLDELVNMAGLAANEPDWSLKGSADALEEASVCESCNAFLAFAATLPSLDVWGLLIKAIGLDLVAVAIAGQPMPSFRESFLLKPCSQCLRKTYRMTAKSISKVDNYVKDYSNSCNAHSVGMCYLLAVQRRVSHIAKTRLKTMPFKKDPTFFRCDGFPGIYIDLYRTESKKTSAFYSDIHCGTPPGTQTPGMKFEDVCKYVQKKLKKEWAKSNSCLFSMDEHAKWDEFNDCLEAFECKVPTEEDFNMSNIKAKIREQAKDRAAAAMRERILKSFREVDLEANHASVDRAIELQREIFEDMKSIYDRELDVEEGDIARASIDQQWKRNPYQLFTNNKWARPECVNARGMISMKDTDRGLNNRDLYRKMLQHQAKRFDEIERKKSLFWRPIFGATCKHLRRSDRGRVPFFTEVFCKLERVQHIVMRRLVHIQENEAKESDAQRHYGNAEETFGVLAKHYARDWRDESFPVSEGEGKEDLGLLKDTGFAGSASDSAPESANPASGAAPEDRDATTEDPSPAPAEATVDRLRSDASVDEGIDVSGMDDAGEEVEKRKGESSIPNIVPTENPSAPRMKVD